MKKLVYLSGKDCLLSDTMTPEINAFKESNPDVEVIILNISIPEELEAFNSIVGEPILSTPVMVSYVNDKKIHHFQGPSAVKHNPNNVGIFQRRIDFGHPHKTYTPTPDMVHQANYILGLIAEDKVDPNGITVEIKDYTRKIANGENVTIEEVIEIFKFLFAHQQWRQRGWELPENLTNERILWQAQGGCPAFPWSHNILQEALVSKDTDLDELGHDYVTPDEFAARGGHY